MLFITWAPGDVGFHLCQDYLWHIALQRCGNIFRSICLNVHLSYSLVYPHNNNSLRFCNFLGESVYMKRLKFSSRFILYECKHTHFFNKSLILWNCLFLSVPVSLNSRPKHQWNGYQTVYDNNTFKLNWRLQLNTDWC